MQKIKFTQEGYNNIKKEYDEIIATKRAQAVQRLSKARSMGDLSENSEYTAAKEELSFLEGRIKELEMLMQNAEITTHNAADGKVEIGCKVIVERDGKKEEYSIVGEFEADPMERKLSHTSPIGKALLSKKKGETVHVEVPAGKISYKIVDIHAA